MIHGTLLHDMNQSNDKMQKIDRSRVPVNVPQRSYGTKINKKIIHSIYIIFFITSYLVGCQKKKIIIKLLMIWERTV